MSNGFQITIFLFLIASFCASPAMAADINPKDLAARPVVTLFASSISDLLNVCDLIFDTVDRPDLADSMDARLERYNGFAGINSHEPFGMMFMWNADAISHVVFLPVEKIDDLMTTSTFNVVGFHKVNEKQYEIERPYAPYHVVVRDNYAYMAESLTTIRALRATPKQLTRQLRDQYDLVLNLDLLQIPKPIKSNLVIPIRMAIEAILQRNDGEDFEAARLRRTIGETALNMMDRIVLDTSQLTIGMRFDTETRHLRFEISLTAVPKSRMATSLNQIQWLKSHLEPFTQSDGIAGMVVSLSKSTMIQELFGASEHPPGEGRRLEAGLKLVGEGLGDLSLIGAIHGPDVEVLNRVLPDFLNQWEYTGQFEQIDPSFDEYLGVDLHSLMPRRLPTLVADLIGSNGELIVGQGKDTIWIGIGGAETLQPRLEETISMLQEPTVKRPPLPVVQGNLQTREVPELVTGNILIPNLDSRKIREVLSEGGDKIHLKIEPIPDGLKIQIECEKGFTRLIGRDWILQIESANRDQPR